MNKRDEAKGFRSVEAEVYVNLVKTADTLMRQMDRLLKPYSLTTTQYNALRILRGAGDDGATCSTIAERLITNDPDVTRLLDRMEKAGLVERARSTTDRRVVLVKISKPGTKLLAQLDRAVDDLHARQFAGLGKREARALVQQLEELRSSEEE